MPPWEEIKAGGKERSVTAIATCQFLSPTEDVVFMLLCVREREAHVHWTGCSSGSEEGNGCACSWGASYQQERQLAMELL